MKKKVVIPTALLIAALAAGGLLYFTHIRPLEKVAAAPAPPPPAPIVAGTVAQHDVPIYLTGVGTVIAYNTDVVRAQIQGQIISINFTEGQTVHAGDLLAQIDPRPYQALIDQYTGNLERDQAQLKNAQANLTRYTQLGDKGWATPQLVETQQAQVGELQAAIKTDQALIDAAKVQLSYTRLTSPIDGVVGIRQIDVGNIISPSNTNGLVVVTQLRSDFADLHASRDEFAANSAATAKDQDAARRFSPTTRITRSSWMKACSASSTTRSCRPPARSSSRRIFPTSRTGSGRASSSTRGCCSMSRHNGLTVPAAVVQQGAKGPYAYVVNPDSTVAIRPIKVAQISDGQALIDSGLKANEQVVVDGQYKLQPGTHVTMLHGKAAEEAAAQDALQAPIP